MSSGLVSIEGRRLVACLPRVNCPNCLELLELHQPDPELPERLLGTCPECKAWVLIDTEAGLMALLPNLIPSRETEGRAVNLVG